jgi:hypothetical protein
MKLLYLYLVYKHKVKIIKIDKFFFYLLNITILYY